MNESTGKIDHSDQAFCNDRIVIPIINDHYVFVNFGKIIRLVLVDTGATLNMVNLNLLKAINPKLISKIVPNNIPSVIIADGTEIPIIGTINLKFRLHHNDFNANFIVMPTLKYSAILGLDFFHKYKCILNYASKDLIIPKFPTNTFGSIFDRT